jgi:voltage-gated potassium channel
MGLLVLILISVGFLLIEAVSLDDNRIEHGIEFLSDAITWVFIFELAIRFWIAPKKKRFFRRYWIDILAVAPVIRPLRLFRVVRLLRLFRAGLFLNRRLATFQGVFRGASAEFTVLGTVTAVLVLTASVTLHLTEHTTNPDFSTFSNAVWFSVYSLIGGEPIGGTPTSTMGRFVTLVLMLGGMTTFGVFVGTVSASMVARLSKRMEINEMDIDELKGHVVVCGWNQSGPTVLQELFFARGGPPRAVVVVTEQEGLPKDIELNKVRHEMLYHVTGDYTRVDVLERAGIRRAGAALLLSDTTVPRTDQDRDARTVLAGLTIERLAKGIFTSAQINDRENETVLRLAGVEEIVVTSEYAGYILGSVGRTFGLVNVLDDILSARHGNAFHKAILPSELDGTTVGELHRVLKDRYQAILISVEVPSDQGPKVQVNPPSDMRLKSGMPLVLIAQHPVRW